MKFSFGLVAITLLFSSFSHADECPGFYAANEPFYSANFSTTELSETIPRPLRFVSYNIHYGLKLSEIIRDLSENENLNRADFIFLQEVYGDMGQDSSQAKDIARALNMNYVFSPSMKSRGHDYGNAILSRWPLSDFKKILLPKSNMEKCNQRTALGAIAQIGSRSVQLFTIHLSLFFKDSIWTDKARANQAAALLSTLSDGNIATVIAGDFNTFNPLGTRRLVKKFKEEGFETNQSNSGHTLTRLPFILDHFFARSFELGNNGIASGLRSSDHLPIWWDLNFQDEQPTPLTPHNENTILNQED